MCMCRYERSTMLSRHIALGGDERPHCDHFCARIRAHLFRVVRRLHMDALKEPRWEHGGLARDGLAEWRLDRRYGANGVGCAARFLGCSRSVRRELEDAR